MKKLLEYSWQFIGLMIVATWLITGFLYFYKIIGHPKTVTVTCNGITYTTPVIGNVNINCK